MLDSNIFFPFCSGVIDGKPIERELVHTYSQGMDDLIGVMCENISLEILSGTNSKTIQLPRTYTKSVNEFVFATKAPHIDIKLNPKGDYVIIQITSLLEKGIYRIEFPGRIPTITPTGKVIVGPIGNVGPTKTPNDPTSLPTSIIAPIWAFKVSY